MQIHHHEERRRTRGVHIAQYPTVVDVSHDVFNGSEGTLLGGGVTHSEPDPSKQLVDQHQQRQHPEEIPEIEVFRRIILRHMRVPRLHDRQTRVNPVS